MTPFMNQDFLLKSEVARKLYHEHAEIVARRLVKFGINVVRLHQMDADSACPNLFNFTRGVHENNTLTFDPRSLDRLDYLQACLKKEGIYVYVDGIYLK